MEEMIIVPPKEWTASEVNAKKAELGDNNLLTKAARPSVKKDHLLKNKRMSASEKARKLRPLSSAIATTSAKLRQLDVPSVGAAGEGGTNMTGKELVTPAVDKWMRHMIKSFSLNPQAAAPVPNPACSRIPVARPSAHARTESAPRTTTPGRRLIVRPRDESTPLGRSEITEGTGISRHGQIRLPLLDTPPDDDDKTGGARGDSSRTSWALSRLRPARGWEDWHRNTKARGGKRDGKKK